MFGKDSAKRLRLASRTVAEEDRRTERILTRLDLACSQAEGAAAATQIVADQLHDALSRLEQLLASRDDESTAADGSQSRDSETP